MNPFTSLNASLQVRCRRDCHRTRIDRDVGSGCGSNARRRAGFMRWPLVVTNTARCLAVLMFVAVASQHTAQAQVLYGSLTGNVTDQTGAAITGAKVEVLNVNTSISKSTTTDDRGSYLFSDLQPGVYKVTIEATSFKTVSQRDVRIDA